MELLNDEIPIEEEMERIGPTQRTPWETISVLRVGCALIVAIGSLGARAEELQPRAALENGLLPFVNDYCLDCHNSETAEAGLSFTRLTKTAQLNEHRRAWQKVLRRLASGEMPPEDMPQPSPRRRREIVAQIQAELDSFDCQGPHFPGRVPLHRLNRTEYRNTVADLLGVEFNPDETFPQDELGYGFNNNANALSLSPLLLEKYLDAAEQIAARAIFPPEAVTRPSLLFSDHQLQGGLDYGRERMLTTEGQVFTPFHFLQAGEYLLRVAAFASRSGDERAKMHLQVNGETIRTVEVLAEEDDPQAYIALVHVREGMGEVGVEFINDYWEPEHLDPDLRDRNLIVVSLEVVGPLDRRAMRDKCRLDLLPEKPTHEQWQHGHAWQAPARRTLESLLSRAMRRPASASLVDRYLGLLNRSRQQGESFERAMQLVVEAVLVSPQFLFREGAEATEANASGIRDLNEYELASRLSYFLWSTMPDEALFREAAAGTLRTHLDAQCGRMLGDPRADELVRNFGLQWLETPRLGALRPDAELFPEFDHTLREAMVQETFWFLRDVFQSDAPLATLFTADYSFLNERLARHYGIAEVTGDNFRRVQMPPAQRAGMLTHASVLTLTSHSDRTSPVNRGKWVLKHLYNDPPPSPPADVPDLAKTQAGGGERLTLREQLVRHREDRSCAVCHERMDPLGFALENFDPLGRWREQDGADLIDARGRLPDGREFTGPTGLRDVLLEDLDAFRKSFAEQLLTYALGRGLKYYDACAIEEIAAKTQAGGDSFSSMILALVRSAPFQQQAVGDTQP